jgi:hypothetical protein
MPQVIPEAVFIGYIARPKVERPEWRDLKPAGVESICSVAQCSVPEGFDELYDWRDNGMRVYDTPELAWGIMEVSLRPQCDLFAYWTYPVRYVLGSRQKYSIPTVKPVPMDNSFTRLGYDVVSWEPNHSFFGHSPLSCNGLAAEVPVNRYFLLATAEEAFALAPTLEVPGQPMRGEPGPYHIVEIWRQRVSPPTS